MATTMLEDQRPIKGIYFNDAEGGCYEVGIMGCTRIEVYGEPGEYCNKPWIAIYKSDELTTRIPAGMAQIVYV